jgi:hypothetical protein
LKNVGEAAETRQTQFGGRRISVEQNPYGPDGDPFGAPDNPPAACRTDEHLMYCPRQGDRPSHQPGAGRGLTDQTGQVGKNQDQGRGEDDQACLPDFGLFEHGHLPFVFVGVASNTRSKDLSGYSVTPGRGLKSHPGKTRRRHLLL